MRELLIDCCRGMSESERQALAATLAALERVSFSDPWTDAMFLEAFDNPVVHLVTLSEDGTLLAYALYTVIAPEAELLNLAVSPACRRQGLATALLDFADAYLRGEGVSDIFLEVRKSNAPAATLYTRRGFCPIGIRRGYYRFPTEDAVVMAFRLD